MSKELSEFIDELIQQKTFSLDALDSIKELRDNAKKQEAARVALEERVSELREMVSDAQKEIEVREKERVLFLEREKELKEREKKVTDLEKSEAVAKAYTEAYKEAMQMVFRPNTIRESIHKNVPLVMKGYGQDAGEYHQDHQINETIVKEEG